ncbi:hypothetical protein [Leifsonia sp. Root112D2]|uniref:hypothetical protein n=1 Tax=Leifsonia sp. Root112D2 TaxID=1736426 RepID=UPI000AAB4824|nr:hypothetical protein [Leifsonia sp. Root112D2]
MSDDDKQPDAAAGAPDAPETTGDGAVQNDAAQNGAAHETPDAAPAGASPLPVPGVSYTPSRKDRLRPAELIGFAAILAFFVGLVSLIATREFVLAGVAFGVVFILSLIVLAMFSLSFKPGTDEVRDLREQNREH